MLDIDGVVADVRHRLPLLGRAGDRNGGAGSARRPDWEAFFARAAHDPVLEEGLAVARRLAADHEVVYVSGRPERLRAVTETWLARHGLPAGRVVLRPDGDHRPARVLKREVVRRLARRRAVSVVVDDDLEVARALREAGFPVLVADWARPDGDGRTQLREAQEGVGLT